MHIIIVRHGVTDHNLSRRIQGQVDTPLNAQGLQQAAELGRALSDEAIDHVYSSDLRRARQTTEAVLRANRAGLPVDFTPALRERHYGEYQDQPLPHIYLEYEEFGDGREDRAPAGGESLSAFHARIGAFWAGLLSRHSAGTILLSAHGGVTRSLMTHALGEDLAFRHSLKQGNCCLNRLERRDGQRFELTLVNSLDHLSAPTVLPAM
ncbi:histidine phosphatase family protein [Granulosicoccaceae sp. 1_MG-2023]|nr:histidine phosphatase family protein [Granulosicoccaceae sp. 1_MG-2023]